MTPDIRQHVARRVRITRIYFRLSVEQSADFLGMPVWLLDYKEGGMLHFSYRELQDLERLYNTSWRIFFQDYADSERSSQEGCEGAESLEAHDELAVIVKYLSPGSVEWSNENTDRTDTELDLSLAAFDTRVTHVNAGRWA